MFIQWLLNSIIWLIVILGEALLTALLATFISFIVAPIISIIHTSGFWTAWKECFIVIWVVIFLVVDIVIFSWLIMNSED